MDEFQDNFMDTSMDVIGHECQIVSDPMPESEDIEMDKSKPDDAEVKVQLMNQSLKHSEAACFYTSESVENSIFLINGQAYRLVRSDQFIVDNESKVDNNEGNLDVEGEVEFSSTDSCSCKEACDKCKYSCTSCKTSCRQCNFNFMFKNNGTDTDDFEKYLETCTKKNKFKNASTDTFDLDSHFDFYKPVNNEVKILKTVGTDCKGLISERPRFKSKNKSSIGVDTSDLNLFKNKCFSESDPDNFDEVSNSGEVLETKYEDLPSLNNKTQLSTLPDENMKPKSDNDSSSEDSDLDLGTLKKMTGTLKLLEKFNIDVEKAENNEKSVFKCCFCNWESQTKPLVFLHIKDHTINDQFKCLKCENNFSSPMDLKNHFNSDHGKRSISVKTGDQTSRNDKNVNSDIKIGNQETDSDQKKKSVRKTRVRREIICLLCGKEFKSKNALKDHLPVHTGAKNYQCDICHKSYTTSANLHTHKLTHTGAKNFKCTMCDKAFHKKDSLKVHFRKHSGEKPFQCDLCPMRFDRNYILKNHRLRHFEEKSYICPTCGKAFTTLGGLSNHEKCHSKDPELKKIRKPAVRATLETDTAVICDECGKVYSTPSNLKMHKLVHRGLKPFKCPVCQHSYAKKDSMLTHMRTHTDERPFACDICGMTFFRKHTLKTHRLRHTGERPHKCYMCQKSFTQSSSLAYHLKHHDRMIKTKLNTIDEGLKLPKKKRFSSTLKQISMINKRSSKNVKCDNKVDKDNSWINNEKHVSLHIKESNDLKKGNNVAPDPEKDTKTQPGNNFENLVYHVGKNQTSIIETLNFMPPNKVNCFVTKEGNILTITKQNKRIFTKNKKGQIVLQEEVMNRDNLITLNKENDFTKHEKVNYITVDNTIKADGEEFNTIHVTESGEILNSTLINENGELVPFGSVTLAVDSMLINPTLFTIPNIKSKVMPGRVAKLVENEQPRVIITETELADKEKNENQDKRIEVTILDSKEDNNCTLIPVIKTNRTDTYNSNTSGIQTAIPECIQLEMTPVQDVVLHEYYTSEIDDSSLNLTKY